jgi:general secretion pathway protein D
VTIAITPRIQDNEVVLHVSPVINEITAFRSFQVANTSFENPVIASKAITTVAKARSGETVLLGGLIDRKTQRAEEGIPGLARIPFLGVLFRSTDAQEATRELVILVTPSVGGAPPGASATPTP